VELAAALELLSKPLTFAPEETASAGALMGKPAPRPDAAMTEPQAEKPAVAEDLDDPLKTLCWALMASNEFLYVE
jgi:hypothetical protein